MLPEPRFVDTWSIRDFAAAAEFGIAAVLRERLYREWDRGEALGLARDLAGLTGIFYCLTYIGFAFPAILTELSHSIEWMTYPVMLGGGMVIACAMAAVIALNSRVGLPQPGQAQPEQR